MRKMLSVLLALCLCCGLGVGCGKSSGADALVEKTIKVINEKQTLKLEFVESKENEGLEKGTTDVTHLYEDGANSVNIVTFKDSIMVSMISVSMVDKNANLESALLAAKGMGILGDKSVKDIENDIKKKSVSEFGDFQIGYLSGVLVIMPLKDAKSFEWDSMGGIDKKVFLDNFTELISKMQYKLEDKNDFEESGKKFESYTMTSILDSAYLACATEPDEQSLTDVMVISNPGAFTYYYATQVLLSIDENIDYKTILKELDVTEDGTGEIGTKVTKHNDINFAFERKVDKQQLAVMFY